VSAPFYLPFVIMCLCAYVAKVCILNIHATKTPKHELAFVEGSLSTISILCGSFSCNRIFDDLCIRGE